MVVRGETRVQVVLTAQLAELAKGEFGVLNPPAPAKKSKSNGYFTEESYIFLVATGVPDGPKRHN